MEGEHDTGRKHVLHSWREGLAEAPRVCWWHLSHETWSREQGGWGCSGELGVAVFLHNGFVSCYTELLLRRTILL